MAKAQKKQKAPAGQLNSQEQKKKNGIPSMRPKPNERATRGNSMIKLLFIRLLVNMDFDCYRRQRHGGDK
jgi:hypothetical protein